MVVHGSNYSEPNSCMQSSVTCSGTCPHLPAVSDGCRASRWHWYLQLLVVASLKSAESRCMEMEQPVVHPLYRNCQLIHIRYEKKLRTFKERKKKLNTVVSIIWHSLTWGRYDGWSSQPHAFWYQEWAGRLQCMICTILDFMQCIDIAHLDDSETYTARKLAICTGHGTLFVTGISWPVINAGYFNTGRSNRY